MKNKIYFKGLKFLYTIIFVYILLFFFDKENIGIIINKFQTIFYQLIPIFVFIIIVTALINYFIKPKMIVKHLGEDSGFKGVLYAMIGGIVSHGPMYAWYGTISELRKHGLKDELLIVFFYSRAIKIPMLPFMIGIFGMSFTIVISLYILLFAFIQGKIINKLLDGKQND
ncbi:MAG: permease [Campylobacterota bacterium]|nr:permease [Campylobacterota bacterium]